MVRWIDPHFLAEARASLKLAIPLIAAQLAAIGMGMVDTIMAGRLGARELAAVAVGSNINMALFVFFMGVLMACSPIIAQRAGAGVADERVGGFAREALVLALVLGALWIAVVHLISRPILSQLGLQAATVDLADEFLQAVSWSAVPLCLWFVLRYIAEGLGQTRPIFVAGMAGFVSNALFAWLLIYGHWGLPRLGAVGCGWATTIACALMTLILALHYVWQTRLREVQLFRCARIRLSAVSQEVLRLGLPIGLILLAEAGLFSAAALLMARFGDQTIAAYQVAINFASMMFMIPLGLGLATTVRVGQAMGAGKYVEARYRGRVGMQLGLLNAASNALLMILFARQIVAVYTESIAIAAQAVSFLWLAAFFQFFDGLQVTANGALRGIKDTRVPMLVTVIAYWLIGMPVALWLAFRTPLGAAGVWWGLTAGLGVAALGLSLRFLDKAGRNALPRRNG